MYNFLRNCYRAGKVTAEQVWEAADSGKITEEQAQKIRYNSLLLSGKLWTYLADLNEQVQDRLERIIDQMKAADGITEALKASNPMAWVSAMNNIRARAEEIIREELIFI